jgi:hypothetical protein
VGDGKTLNKGYVGKYVCQQGVLFNGKLKKMWEGSKKRKKVGI